MRTFYKTLTTALLLAVVNFGITTTVLAQRQYRETDATISNLLQQIENRFDTLRQDVEYALNRTRINGTVREDEINRLIRDFENATDQLRTRFENRRSTSADVRLMLDRAAQLNQFFINNRLDNRVQQDWRLLQADLDQLARAYYIDDWRWNTGGISTGPVGSNDFQLRQLVRRIENRTNQFSRSFRQDLNTARIDSRQREEASRRLNEFENDIVQLRNRLNNRSTSPNDVQATLDDAAYLNSLVTNQRLSAQTESDWTALRSDLDQLASSYGIAANWNSTPVPGGGYGSDGRLTGTYRLDTSQSGDARRAAEDATRNLPAGRRERVYDSLIRRLDSPETLAIDQRGTNVTIASSRAPQINFVADGREHVETNPNGRTVRVRASLSGNQLTITRTGDRAQDFTVSFDPIDNGRRLRVTRELYSDQFSQPIRVESYYDRSSDVAQLDLYNDNTNTGTVTGDYVIPNGTELVAVLNSDISTQNAKEGDRFTMAVRSPGQYEGATIEGYLSNVSRGGRITGRSEATLNFENIRLRDGRTYRFAGILESARTPNGEVVRVDNEGAVRESDQTNRTVTRTAIGTGLGAIIGAIAGGGKGAAIGAVIGAGAGAGSVYVQGRQDLELPSGSEITLRATGPR
jgi:YMGG-like Gly-zipper